MANRMKSYVYTYTSRRTNKGYRNHTVTLCRIKRNKLVFIGTMTRAFVSEIQLALMIMAEHKELPIKVLENSHSVWFTWSIRVIQGTEDVKELLK